MITLEYDQTVALLKQARDERGPDYVYNPYTHGCFYFNPDKTPSCIIGYVLLYAGVDPDAFLSYGKGYISATSILNRNQNNVASLIRDGVISCDDRTHVLLVAVQAAQDDRMPWGEALEYGLRAVEALA